MDHEVVISGVGARFPECECLPEYRQKLLENLHLVSDNTGNLMPKYDGTPLESKPFDDKDLMSGKIKYGDKFDNTFFGMHSRLAAATDAICRNVLERTLEALLDAGYNPNELKGSNTGVYMGYHCSESESNFIRESADGFGIMGLNAGMTANRVSYWLDARGTSFTHNTGIVSGIEGVEMAYKAINKGEYDRAVVGCASLSYLAELAVHYDDLGWLSSTGSCKPFDEAADGGIRSESVVVLLLERKSLARRVYASVKHIKTNFCAELCQSEIPRIQTPTMAASIKQFYDESGINPNDIHYVEADGWGVKDIDRAELESLDEGLAKRRSKPLLVGSVKGNIGQTEAASGLVALCKVLIAMESGQIPATINYVNGNSGVEALKKGRIQIVTENTPWEGGLAAVNNIGLGGMVGHVVLCSNQRQKPINPPMEFPNLMMLSGRTPEGLEEVLKTVEKNAKDPEFVSLMHHAFSKHIFGHMYRTYNIAPRLDDEKAPIQFYTGQKRPIWFVYSGMGSQWPTMGSDLMSIPVFAAAVERCHQALLPLGLDLKHIITTSDASIFDDILHSFVGIAAVQIGLTDVLRTVGIVPDGIIGHSVGELGCAYADGCITAEQMVLAAHARGQASNETELIPGMMAAVGLSYDDVKGMLPESIEVACHNSSTSCTLSGPTADMNDFVAKLKAKSIFARTVNVSNIAYHSRYIKPAAPRLLELLKKVILDPKERSSRWVSTSVEEKNWDTPLAKTASAEFFTNNLLSSVYFEEGSRKIPKDALVIEIAPHGLMQAILKRSLATDVINIPLTKRDSPSTRMVLNALGKMYLEGLNPEIKNLYPPVEFPVSRGTECLSVLATWDHRDTWPVAFLKAPAGSGPRTELHLPLALSTDELAHLAHCTWNGHSILSPSACIALVIDVVSSYNEKETPIVFSNVTFYDTIIVPQEGSREVYVYIQRGTGHFEISVAGQMVAVGRASGDPEIEPSTVEVSTNEDRVALDGDYVYEELGRRGLVCKGDFRAILQLNAGTKFWTGSALAAQDASKHLEAILQVVILQHSEGHHQLYRPKSIHKIVYHPLKVPAEPAEMPLVYDAQRRCFTFGSMEVGRVETRAVPLSPTFRSILVNGRAWMPYDSTGVGELQKLASMSLQVAALQTRLPLLVTAMTKNPESSPLLGIVVQVAEHQLPDFYMELQHGGTEGQHSALLVSDVSFLNEALALVKRSQGLLLAEVPRNYHLPGDVHLLLSCSQGDKTFALLKQRVAIDPESEVLDLVDEDIPDERLQLSQNAVVYVVSRNTLTNNIPDVMRTITSKPGGARAHLVFIQDPNAPPFNPTKSPYADHLRLGLRMNVLKGGKWGGVHRTYVGNVSSTSNIEPLRRTRLLTAMEGGLRVQALGVNPYNDAVEDGTDAVGLLDYTARRHDGVRVMGVCHSSAAPLQPDTTLVWPVPPAWSDEDAASVPLAYSTALYVLREVLLVSAEQSVLVVGGCTALGHAALSLLVRMGCKVLTTARDHQHRDRLLAAFPSLSSGIIVAKSPEELCCILRTRSGCNACVDKVLSQGEPGYTQSVMYLLKKYGSLAHVGADHTVIQKSVGLNTFVKSTSMYSVAWDWPQYARAEVKGRVKDWLLSSINKGLVKPLPIQIMGPHDLGDAQRRVMQTGGKVALDMKGQTQQMQTPLEPGKTCLVIGSSAARAVSVVEWLLSSGAREVSVYLAGRAVGSWLTRRLQLLSTHYGASVRALPTGEPQQLVKTAAQAAPLGLVLVLPLESGEQHTARVRVLDGLTRTPGCTLAVLATAGLHDVEELSEVVRCRREQGYPAVLASMGDLPADVRMTPFHQVLRAANNPTITSTNLDVVQLLPKEEICVSEDGSAALPNLLPNSVEALRRLGLSLSGSPNHPLVLPSLIGGAPGRRNREVPPVFLISGVSDNPSRELEPIARKLMATAVVLNPPAMAVTVEEAGQALVPQVLAEQPEGPYTFAGCGWGGCVALEAARVLEARGARVSVFLLDAAPDTLHSAVQMLGSHPNGLETSLLKFLLNLDKETEEQVYRAQSWSARLHAAVGKRDAVLEKALNCLLLRVQALMAYAPRTLGENVYVNLLSKHSYHQQSALLNEISSEVTSHSLHSMDPATIISSGVHVGRGSMKERKALASLTVDF